MILIVDGFYRVDDAYGVDGVGGVADVDGVHDVDGVGVLDDVGRVQGEFCVLIKWIWLISLQTIIQWQNKNHFLSFELPN